MKSERNQTFKLSKTQIDAQKAFKIATKTLTDDQMEAQVVQNNRLRLKALRLYRDAGIDRKQS